MPFLKQVAEKSKDFDRDGEVPFQKELSSFFEELFGSKVPCQKELGSSNEELFPTLDFE